jgi:hypothetical protein
MAKSGSVMIRGALGAALMVAAVGCGSAQQRPAMEQQAASEEVAPEPSVGPAPECVDDQDRQVTCLSDADCCPNFVCGKDPDRNFRESYCIFGG